MKLKNKLILLIILIFSGCGIPQNQLNVFNNTNKYDLDINFSTKTQKEIIKFNEYKQKDKKTTSTKIKPPIIKPIMLNKKYNIKITKNNPAKKEIALNVENIPIPDFIKLVFGQILNYNYVLSDKIEKIKKTTTLKMDQKVSKEEFLNIVTNILSAYSITLKKDKNIYYIKKGKTKTIKKFSDYFFYGKNLPANLSNNVRITLMIPFYYIDYMKIKWMLTKFYLSKNAYIVGFRKDNILIITDQVSYIKKALTFINIMDVPTLRNKTTYMLTLKYIDLDIFLKRIKDLLPASGIKIANNLHELGLLLKPIPELNSILVVSDKKEWIKILLYWKQKLDIIDVNSENPQIFIYKPKNRSAGELVSLIKELFSNTLTKKEKKEKNKRKFKLQVMEDKDRNSLIVYALPSEYKKIYQMLQKLDTLPKQVLIQVTIAEITLKDSLQYGFEWFLKNSSNTATVSTLGNLGIGSGGLVGSVINSGQTFQAILNFLAQKNLINILSSPKLLVLDNQSANINVGTQVPVLTSSTTTQTDSAATQVSQSVQYRTTGITLSVTPTIHSNGALTLQISQVVSDPQPNNTSSISSPIILNRSLTTKVILKSNQALLLGGLIRESVGKTINKVPLLGDIPYIGNLFKTVSYSKDRTELIIIVKPIIISNTNEANDITNGFKQLLQDNTGDL